jgi:hypothetical protein
MMKLVLIKLQSLKKVNYEENHIEDPKKYSMYFFLVNYHFKSFLVQALE